MLGYTNDEIVRHGVLQPDTSFLQKPFNGSELAAAVREALAKPLDERPSGSGAVLAAEHSSFLSRSGRRG